MPIHDWTRVGPAVCYDFELGWLYTMRDFLNRCVLPTPYFARCDPIRRRVTLWGTDNRRLRTQVIFISHDTKAKKSLLTSIVRKVVRAVNEGIHALVIDPFPATRRTPHGLHSLIWEELGGEWFAQPADQPLTLAAYEATDPAPRCYVEPVAVGQPLPDMPLFLEPDYSIDLPVEATYLAAWAAVVPQDRALLDPPAQK